MDDERRRIAAFSDYAGMLAAIRGRVNELQINGERFDDFAGLPRGYLSKLIGVRPVRRISMVSMGPLFEALGITCVMVEDPTATARLKRELKPRNNSFARRTALYVTTTTSRQWSRVQKLGRAARWDKLSDEQKSEIMREVRAARERKRRLARER
jgi:hypothetical protein